MWRFFENRYPRLPVVGGRVACAVQSRDIDVEHCLGCPRLWAVSKQQDGMFVRCRSRCAATSEPLRALMI